MICKKIHNWKESWYRHSNIQVSNLKLMGSSEYRKKYFLEILEVLRLYRRELSRTSDPKNIRP